MSDGRVGKDADSNREVEGSSPGAPQDLLPYSKLVWAPCTCTTFKGRVVIVVHVLPESWETF